jgi:uncharacterized protein
MIIDGHAHSFGLFYTADKIKKTLDRLGVDKVVLCSMGIGKSKKYFVPSLGNLFPWHDVMSWINGLISWRGRKLFKEISLEIMLDKPNEYLVELADSMPDRIIPFYWTNPARVDLMEDLINKHSKRPLRGIKLHQSINYFHIDTDEMRAIMKFAGEIDVPVFIHLHKAEEAEKLKLLAVQFPKTKIISAHLLGLEQFLKDSRLPDNIYFDISPHSLISKHRVMKAYQNLGPGRLIMGSDTPFGCNGLKKNIRRVRSLKIPQAEKDMILGENLKVLLKL